MIKSASTGFAIECENCLDLYRTESGVEAFVPVRDLETNSTYRLEFRAIRTSGHKEHVPRTLRDMDGGGADVLPELDEDTRIRFERLLNRVNSSGLCGRQLNCPGPIKRL